MITGRFYSAKDLATKKNITRQRLHALAKERGWTKYVGVFYNADDIDEYEETRLRTRLSKELGWVGRGLITDDNRDMECPTCGAFAVKAPATIEEIKSARWQRAEWDWKCAQGHQGKKSVLGFNLDREIL